MKRIFTLGIILCAALTGFAQVDTTGKQNQPTESDTIKVGGMIIIRKPGGGKEVVRDRRDRDSTMPRRKYSKPSNVSTNWWILDLGFSNYNDQTNYVNALASDFTGTGVNEETMKLKTWKSRNVNIWFFMQKLNVVKHVINLKYGLGLELNNYHFDDNRIHLSENPTKITLDPNYEGLDKNKLAADYITVPLMLNINFTPGRGRGFGISGGVSAGYLYSSRQKIKNGGDKDKTHDDFDLRKWKISYVGELILGPVKLYGSYATQSMWEKGLDQTPYTVGARFANW
jgi:hypothetical protein